MASRTVKHGSGDPPAPEWSGATEGTEFQTIHCMAMQRSRAIKVQSNFLKFDIRKICMKSG
jgi:hypothetical protein